MCTGPCMDEKTDGCCWVPALLAGHFSCCKELGCCRDSGRVKPPIRPHLPSLGCQDLHKTCGTLKQELARKGKTCASDLGVFNTSLKGKTLRDECCATCATNAPKSKAKCAEKSCIKCVTSFSVEFAVMNETAAINRCRSFGLDCTSFGCQTCVNACVSADTCKRYGLVQLITSWTAAINQS